MIFHYDTMEAVPEEFRKYAKAVEAEGEHKGKFAVKLVAGPRLDEMRSNNEDLAKKLETETAFSASVLKATGIKREEFDAEKVGDSLKELHDTFQKVNDGKLKASDDIEKELEKRTEAMRNKFDETTRAHAVEKSKLEQAKADAEAKYKRTFIDRAVIDALSDEKLGVQTAAAADIMLHAYGIFHVEDDNTLTPKKNGQTIWGETGSTPMTMKEWIDTVLRKEKSYFFKPSVGGGADNGNGSEGIGGFSKEQVSKMSSRQKLALANKQAFENAKK